MYNWLSCTKPVTVNPVNCSFIESSYYWMYVYPSCLHALIDENHFISISQHAVLKNNNFVSFMFCGASRAHHIFTEHFPTALLHLITYPTSLIFSFPATLHPTKRLFLRQFSNMSLIQPSANSVLLIQLTVRIRFHRDTFHNFRKQLFQIEFIQPRQALLAREELYIPSVAKLHDLCLYKMVSGSIANASNHNFQDEESVTYLDSTAFK